MFIVIVIVIAITAARPVYISHSIVYAVYVLCRFISIRTRRTLLLALSQTSLPQGLTIFHLYCIYCVWSHRMETHQLHLQGLVIDITATRPDYCKSIVQTYRKIYLRYYPDCHRRHRKYFKECLTNYENVEDCD